MKRLIILALFISGNVYAGQTCSESMEQVIDQKELTTNVPKYLEGAVITVQLKDGRTSSVPAEKFKVVPRKQQFIVTKTTNTMLCSTSEKNRVSVLGGYGAKASLSHTTDADNKTTVKTNEGLVGGVQYQRKVIGQVSVGAQVQSNKTTSFILGVDF